ncbi:MAG: hypothetical protein ACQESG_06535 [Nanobdellota archaeon]
MDFEMYKTEFINDCVRRAIHRLMKGDEPDDILTETGDVVPDFEPLKSIDVTDEKITILTARDTIVKLNQVYSRHVSQKVVAYERLVERGGTVSDADDLSRRDYEHFERDKQEISEWSDTGFPKDLFLKTLAKSKYGINSECDPIYDIRSRSYGRSDIIKIIDNQPQFWAEFETLMKLSMVPGMNVPMIGEMKRLDDGIALDLTKVMGFPLCDISYSLGSDVRPLVEGHLMDLALIQCECDTVEIATKGKTLLQERQDYDYILGRMMKHYGLSGPDIGGELSSFPTFSYRDASLFNVMIDYQFCLALMHREVEIPEAVFHEMERETYNLSMAERVRYLQDLHDYLDDLDVTMPFELARFQIDFGSMHKRAFQLEDFLLAVDNPFLAPSEDVLQEYLSAYQHYLSEIGDVTIQDAQRQLVVGGFYRQLKNFHYLESGRLDYGEKQEEFAAYYFDRVRRYGQELGIDV